MSNDLISRSAVMKLIESKCTDDCFGNEDITLIDAHDLLDDVSELPTAHDVDKVVEQLEDYLFERYCIEGDSKIDEIIKAGGVNER